MNTLTNERLNTIASWRKTYGDAHNVMMPAHEAEELVSRLLAAEAQLAELRRERETMHSIEYVQGLVSKIAGLEAQLAELGKPDPVAINFDIDGVDMDCVRDRTCRSDDYCEGFVDGMIDAERQIRENNRAAMLQPGNSVLVNFRDRCRKLVGVGSLVPDFAVFTNIENALRRSNCLGAIEHYMSVYVGTDENDDVPMYHELLHWGEEPAKYIETFKGALPKFLAANSPVSPDSSVPEGYCIMPLKLTAANGAKGALSGEFHITRDVTCHECGGEGCKDCSDRGSWEEDIPIGCDIIKLIYKAAVDACSVAAAPQPTPATPIRYMNRFTGACFTLEQQPDAATDTDVYIPLVPMGKGGDA